MNKNNKVNHDVILESLDEWQEETQTDCPIDRDLKEEVHDNPLAMSSDSSESTFSQAVRNSMAKSSNPADFTYSLDINNAEERDHGPRGAGEDDLERREPKDLKDTELQDLDLGKDEIWDPSPSGKSEMELDDINNSAFQHCAPNLPSAIQSNVPRARSPGFDPMPAGEQTRCRAFPDGLGQEGREEEDDFTAVSPYSRGVHIGKKSRIFMSLFVLCVILLLVIVTLAIVAYTSFNKKTEDWVLRRDMATEIVKLDQRISDAVGRVVHFVTDDSGNVAADSVDDCIVTGTWLNASSSTYLNYTVLFNRTGINTIKEGLTLEERNGIVVVCHGDACSPANISKAVEKPLDLDSEIEKKVDPVRGRVSKLEARPIYTVDEANGQFAPLDGNVNDTNIGRHIDRLIDRKEVYVRMNDLLAGIRNRIL